MKTLLIVLALVLAPSVASAQTCGPDASAEEKTVCAEREKAGGAVGLSQPAGIVSFLKSLAASLNANGISGGPFGILVKDGGHNCNGYSCDIICSGNGSSQRQWDVLVDAGGQSLPVWQSLSQIAVRPCEIVASAPPSPAPVPQPPTVDLGPVLSRLSALENEIVVLKADARDIRAIIAALPPPQPFPVYKGSLFGIAVISRPCPTCK
jgi:hypothetical protein